MRTSRRTLLRSAGAALLCAPFYRLLTRPNGVRAATAPKRIIFWFSPNGTVHQFWRPTGSEAQFDFPAGSILEPLAAHKSDLLVLDGLNFVNTRGQSHEGGMEHTLTEGGDPSIDQYIASQLGMATAFPSLELGVQTSLWGSSIQTRMSYDDKHEFVQPEDDPSAVFQRLFGGAAVAPAAMSGTAPAVDPQKSVLSLVHGELDALKKQLGNEERGKLDDHLDALSQLERRAGAAAISGGGGAAGSCGSAKAPSLSDTKSNDSFPNVGALQMDMLIAAAACDLTRVFSLQWTHTVSPTILSWANASEGHHELSHKDDSNTAGVASFVEAERWFAGQFSIFLDKLKATPEADGSGSLFDTSTVIWVKELGDSRLHDFNSVPFVLAGGGNGYWKLGRYLQFSAEPHQKLLVALAQSMGLQLDHFGTSDVTGALARLS
jgi:hypothetical protein